MPTYLKNTVTLALDAAACTGCGMCETVCPHGVFVVSDRKARIANRDACMECGACARNCPAEAIAVDSGVGCAAAFLYSAFTSRPEPCCGEPPEADD